MKTIYQRVLKIILSLGVTQNEIDLQARFSADLGLDSIDMAHLITLLEVEFDINIPDENLYRFVKVINVVEYIQTKLNPIGKPNPSHEAIIDKMASFIGIRKFRKL